MIIKERNKSRERDVESEVKLTQDGEDVPGDNEVQEETTAVSPDPFHALNDLPEAVDQLQQGFAALQNSFDSKIKYDGGKQEIIDSLHRELQDYRDGLHFKILRPVLLDLIGMYDDFDNLLKHTADAEAGSRRNLGSFQGTIEDILYRHGVEMYQEEGDAYVSQRQRSIGVVETNELELDRLVAKRVRPGFAYEGKMLRPEFVKTYRYKQ